MRKTASQSRLIGDFPLCFCNTRKICYARQISDAKLPNRDCDGVFFLDRLYTRGRDSTKDSTKSISIKTKNDPPSAFPYQDKVFSDAGFVLRSTQMRSTAVFSCSTRLQAPGSLQPVFGERKTLAVY